MSDSIRRKAVKMAILCVALVGMTTVSGALAAGNKVCLPVAGQKIVGIEISDGGPPAPDDSNEDTPSGNTWDLTPGVKGGYFATCDYVPTGSPNVDAGPMVTKKSVHLSSTYKTCNGSDHPLQISCKN